MNGFFVGFALAILLWFLAFLYLKAFVRRRTSPDHILELLQEEVFQLTADIDEKTEQNLQLLEDKIQSVREICSEAERRIAVYTHELEKQHNENQTMAVLNKKPLVERLEVENQTPVAAARTGSAAKTVETAYRVEARKPYRQHVASRTSAAEVPPTSHIPLPTHPPTVEQPSPIKITKSREPLAIKPRPMKERIAELQKAGFSPELIAKRLDISIGEVQLYFNFAEPNA